MKKIFKKRSLPIIIILTAALTLFLLQGCATSPKSMSDDMGEQVNHNTQERLNERINEYWSAKVKSDYKKTYEYECAELRNYETMPMYYGKKLAKGDPKRGQYKIIEIKATDEENVYRVSLRVPTEVALPIGTGGHMISIPVKELWLFENGDWYRKSLNYKSPNEDILNEIKEDQRKKNKQ